LTREEYKKKVWEILKGYLDMPIEDLEELLDKIMTVPLPEKKKGKVTVNKKDKRRMY
jgi:hypothetical protein